MTSSDDARAVYKKLCVHECKFNSQTFFQKKKKKIGGGVGPEDMALLYMFDNVNYSNTIQPIALPQREVIPSGTGLNS